MALVADVLVVTGVALDLVGAGVLAHAHNVESIVELREEVADEGTASMAPGALERLFLERLEATRDAG